MTPFQQDASETLGTEYRLEPEPRFGYLRVVPTPAPDALIEAYGHAYQPSVRPHDPEGRVRLCLSVLPGPGRVLDVGCGRGEFLDVFVKKGWQAMGLEPGERDAAAVEARGIKVLREPFTSDTVDRLGQFDCVFMSHVLEHVVDPQELVRSALRALRPGGIFYCEVPNDFNPLQRAAVEANNLRQWWVCPPNHLNYFTIESLVSLLQGNGFEIAVKTTDFPMEMFLLFGDVYVGNPQLGRAMHEKRCRFEESMRNAGLDDLLQAFYSSMASLGIGREAIVVARKPMR